MTAELVVAFGSFSAMVVTWAFLPGSSRRNTEQEVQEEEHKAKSVLVGE